MPDYKEILYQKQRHGVLITLNRPEALNAITRPMLKELHHALDDAEADPEIRAIVLTGAGRAFRHGSIRGLPLSALCQRLLLSALPRTALSALVL